LVSGIVTTPFGPAGAWQWGNGLYTFRYYDTDGRLNGWEFRSGATVLRNDLSFDTASRITGIANPVTPAAAGGYQYDALDRLTVAQQGNPVTHTQQFSYDALGNRTSFNLDGAAAALYYGSNTHQLQSMVGVVSPTYLGGATSLTYTYNNANRLAEVKSSGATLATYGVSGLGQRLRKDAGLITTLFVYDEQGRLLGEYDGTGQLIQETVWLDDLPIATLRPTGTGTPTPIAIHYVHADHLGSPRAVTRPSDSLLLWQWDNTDPFGNNAANENPAGLGTFMYGLRFPGQYYDAETSTHYNYFRDYDPSIGRYAQSDPIGLRGGINTYLYVTDPLTQTDPEGLMGYRGGKSSPDYSACSYYDSVAANVGCKYHGWAAGTCRGQNAGVEFMSSICMITTAQMNCIRRCLVEEDQNARGRNECKVCTARGACTRLSCINDYHKKCFAKCNVSTLCYGGRYWQGFPSDGDSPGQGQCCG